MSDLACVKIEAESFEQLVILSSVMPVSMINVDHEKKVAFVFLQPLVSSTPVIYYCRVENPPSSRFVYLNRVTGRIRFGEEFSTEPNDVNIPIIRIKNSNITI